MSNEIKVGNTVTLFKRLNDQLENGLIVSLKKTDLFQRTVTGEVVEYYEDTNEVCLATDEDDYWLTLID